MTLVNSEDPDEEAAFHLGLHCKLRQNNHQRKNEKRVNKQCLLDTHAQ